MSQTAASLTYTSLLAIVPFMTVILIIISSVPILKPFSEKVKYTIIEAILPESSEQIGHYLSQFLSNVDKLTIAGIVGLFISVLWVMRTIEGAFSSIWQINRPRPYIQQLAVYWTVLTLGPLLLSAIFSVWGIFYDHFGVRANWPWIAKIVESASAIVLLTFIFWLLYRIVPNRHVPAIHAFIGAILTATLVQCTRHAFGYYIGLMSTYQLLYGAFASFPILLIWLYSLWIVILLGAVLTASLSYWENDAWQWSNNNRYLFECAVQALIILAKAQRQGKTVSLKEIHQELVIGYNLLGELMDTLEKFNYTQACQSGWILKRDARHIQLVEVFKLFIYGKGVSIENKTIEELSLTLDGILISLHYTLEDLINKVRS